MRTRALTKSGRSILERSLKANRAGDDHGALVIKVTLHRNATRAPRIVAALSLGRRYGFRRQRPIVRSDALESKHNHRPQYLALLHPMKSFLDVVDSDGLGDETVEVELTLQV